MIAHRIASGIDIVAISVIRQLPKKIRIITATRMAPITPS